MFIKRVLPLVLAALLCLMPSCSQGEGGSGESADAEKPEGYEGLLALYNEAPLDVEVTLTVDTFTAIENHYSLKEGEGGYTVADLDSDYEKVFTSSEQAYRAVGYLPPYATAYPDGEGVFTSRLSGDVVLEMLLSGSNLFDGYSKENASLEGECLYTANGESALTSYSYEFSVNINDGQGQFPAKIKYYIEVK